MSIFQKMSIVSRKRKIEFFHKIFKPDEQTKLLDVGAEINPNGERGLQLIDQYPWKEKISAINISPRHISSIRQLYPEIETVVGDACALPWPDDHFDIVYSNAVIEHLGSFEQQKRMAAEIMRVGKRWFVCTPNRWYPFEFHLRLPLVTWLPGTTYLRIGRLMAYNHVAKRYVFGIKRDDLRLMTSRELLLCFPNSKIIKQRVTFMAETLIAIGGKEDGSKNE
jgi:ubiquinone/menaquinone biosynthesis C-methylase UbiE